MSSQTVAAPSVRVPKLAVRNRTGTGASNGSDNASQTNSSHSSTRTASPQRDRGTNDPSQRTKPSSMETGARRSGSSHGKQSQQLQQSNSKKKSGGMLGFLTLKEPSTNALEQFAEQQKKAAAAKTGRPTAVGLSSVSVQKLPDHVPKVNSKWDGLPEDARNKLDHKRKTSQETASSLFTTNSRQTYRTNNSSSSDSSTSTRRPIGTMSSRPSSMSSTVRANLKYTVIAPSAAYDTTTPISVHPDPNGEPSPSPMVETPGVQQRDFFQVASPTSASPLSPIAGTGTNMHAARSVRRVSGAVPAELAGRAIAELPGDEPAELPGDEPPQMAGDEPAYITSPGGSPLTPPVDYLPGQTPRVVRPGVVMDAQGTIWCSESDPEENDGRLSDSEVLSASLPKAFGKRPPLEHIAESPIEYPETPEHWPLPAAATLAVEPPDAPATKTPTATPTITTIPPSDTTPPPTGPLPPLPPSDTTPLPTGPLPPIPTNAPSRPLMAPTSIYSQYGKAQSKRPASIAPSLAPSTAPSTNESIDWPLPPTARLAMGGNAGPTPRKADVAPWERFDGKASNMGTERSPAAAKASYNATVDAGPAGSKKRFSGILGRR